MRTPVFEEGVMRLLADLYKDVLRVSAEPCEHLDDRAVHRLLTAEPTRYLKFVRDELEDIALGRSVLELPPKQVFSDPGADSDFRVMPCVVRGPNGTRKTVKLVGTNTAQKKIPNQITVGRAFAIDAEENFVSHAFDACLLSSARTGACAATAVDLLAVSRRKITVIGAGRVGYYAARYAAALKGVEEIGLCDSEAKRAQDAAVLLSQQAPGVRFTAPSRDDIDYTDVLVLATTSVAPVCSPPGFGASLVVSVGADTDSQSELDPAWARVSDVWTDTKDSTRFGDLSAWIKAGLITADDVVDLLGVIRDGGPGRYTRPRVFVSTGSALFDNITIGYLLRERDREGLQRP